tara:strand:+ start:1591 stop:2901 length:1311 start_codon:yes stop_codon:yes gene_type:complete
MPSRAQLRDGDSPEPLSEDSPVVENEESYVCDMCDEVHEGTAYEADIDIDGSAQENVCQECMEAVYSCEECHQHHSEDSDDLRWTEDGDPYCVECFYENYTHCETCDGEIHNDYSMYHEGTGYTYCEECYPGDGDDVDLDSYHTREMGSSSRSFETIKSKRLVGLELECYSDGWDYWDGANEVAGNWRAVHDGSIQAHGEGSRSVEFVSRVPKNGDALWKDVEYITAFTSYDKYEVNRSCGVHVHVDGRDLEYQHLKSLLLLGKSVQNILYKMMPPSRENSRWCRKIPLSRSSIHRIESNQDFIDTWYSSWGVDPSMEKYNDSRYCNMNLHARILHGSIEFRYHSGTLNKEKLLHWIRICTAIVDKARDITVNLDHFTNVELDRIILNRDLTLSEFFLLLDIEEDTQKYILKRIAKFYDYNKKEDYEAMGYVRSNV